MKAVKIEAPGGLDLGDFGTVPGGRSRRLRAGVRRATCYLAAPCSRFGAGWGEAIPLDPRLGLCVEHVPLCQKLVVAVQS